MRNNKRVTAAQLNKIVREDTVWALSFAKKLVAVIVLFFIVSTVYTGIAMWHSSDFSSLGQVYSDVCNLVEVVAFGYLLKAGFENVPKVIIGMTEQGRKDRAEEARKRREERETDISVEDEYIETEVQG